MFVAKAAWLCPCWLHEWRSGKVQGLETEPLDWNLCFATLPVRKSITLSESYFPQMLDWDYNRSFKDSIRIRCKALFTAQAMKMSPFAPPLSSAWRGGKQELQRIQGAVQHKPLNHRVLGKNWGGHKPPDRHLVIKTECLQSARQSMRYSKHNSEQDSHGACPHEAYRRMERRINNHTLKYTQYKL